MSSSPVIECADDELVGLAELERRLFSLPEARMRAAVLSEHLASLDAVAVARLLDAYARPNLDDDGKRQRVRLQAAIDVLRSERWDYDRRCAVYRAAREHELEHCRELLLAGTAEAASEQSDAPRALQPGTRPLTLGERKAMARTGSRDVLDQLLLDPSPRVIVPLLDNPKIRVRDVLQIATCRKTTSAILVPIARHRRWRNQQPIRMALLRHPRLPTAEGLRFVGFLSRVELRSLANDASLHGSLRDAIRRRVTASRID